MTEKFYITTAIDYVNADPHIGHAYEKIIADSLARWNRLQGKKVWFLTGTDENAQKNEQAAKEAGIPVKDFVDKNSKIFEELCEKLNISNDDFIRTTEQRHVSFAQNMFKKIHQKGDIYNGKYEGYYCEGCESFITEKELEDGKCPEHNTKPIFMSEDAYFFKLSKYKKEILDLFKKGLVTPISKANEITARIKKDDLKDLCVSRTNLEWGIDSPIDDKYKIYVWIDALSNYISALGKKEKDFWPADVHAIGKGINWFHSVIWPALLISAGYKPPKKIWVHGYLTVDGKKMSKSLGNVINPISLAEKYPVDSIRYFLVRAIPFESDGDFSEKALTERHNNELADKLGNLVSRVSTLAEKYGIEKKKSSLDSKETLYRVSKYLDNYQLDKALNEIFAFIDKCNEHIQHKKPWETKDSKVLFELAQGIRDAAILLSPFIPETSEKIAKNFNFKISLDEINKPLKTAKIKKSEILFKKL
jgi:methionyl-tRNA synthetase